MNLVPYAVHKPTMKLTHTLGNGSQLFKGKFKQIDEPVTEKEKRKLIYDC